MKYHLGRVVVICKIQDLEYCNPVNNGWKFFHMINTRTSDKHIHRIIEWLGLEGNFRGHLVQPPCSEQQHPQLDQVAQSPVQPGPECFQGWDINHLSGATCSSFFTMRVVKLSSLYPV